MNPYPATFRTLALAAELLEVTDRFELDEVLSRIVAAGSGTWVGPRVAPFPAVPPAPSSVCCAGPPSGQYRRRPPPRTPVRRASGGRWRRRRGCSAWSWRGPAPRPTTSRSLASSSGSAALRPPGPRRRRPGRRRSVVVRDALEEAGRQFAPGLVPAVPAYPADLAVRPWPVPPRPVERTGQWSPGAEWPAGRSVGQERERCRAPRGEPAYR
jgi:hypothetical protein